MPKISAVLIVLNEEKNIKECLLGLRFCDEIVVVDSGSKDRTAEMARAMGARVYPHPFQNFADQKNFGIKQAIGDWVFLIDADERVSDLLSDEARHAVNESCFDGFYVLRCNRIFGRWMKHGINAKDYQLRLVKRDKAVFQGLVHERIYLNEGAARLRSPLLHYSTPDISSYMHKLNVYTTLEAQLLENRKSSGQISRLQWRPFLVFIRAAFGKLGVLDGMEGMVFCILSAYYDFVNGAKRWERTR